MIVRLIPYSQIFVSATLTLDEAAALADALSSAVRMQHDLEVKAVAERLVRELEDAMARAVELQKKGTVCSSK